MGADGGLFAVLCGAGILEGLFCRAIERRHIGPQDAEKAG